MSTDSVHAELKDHVLWVTLDRPERRNAFDWAAYEAFQDCWNRLIDNDDAWVGVIIGAGDKAFSAGADLTTLPQQIAARRDAGDGDAYPPIAFNERFCPKPVIAAINGDAIGGGLELALGCDIRIAAGNARFGLPETRWGGMPGAGGTQRLPRLIGPSNALELMFTTRLMSAEEALRVQLVNQVVDHTDLRDHVAKLAQTMVAQAPLGLRGIKRAVYGGLDVDLNDGLRLEQREADTIIASHDYRAAMDAFSTGSSPRWEGR